VSYRAKNYRFELAEPFAQFTVVHPIRRAVSVLHLRQKRDSPNRYAASRSSCWVPAQPTKQPVPWRIGVRDATNAKTAHNGGDAMPGKRHVPLHGAFFSACAIQVEGWRAPRSSCAAGPRRGGTHRPLRAARAWRTACRRPHKLRAFFGTHSRAGAGRSRTSNAR